jgi:hypothetical protein
LLDPSERRAEAIAMYREASERRTASASPRT